MSPMLRAALVSFALDVNDPSQSEADVARGSARLLAHFIQSLQNLLLRLPT